MSENLENIFHKQQELEYLKSQSSLSLHDLKKECKTSESFYKKQIFKQYQKIRQGPCIYQFLCNLSQILASTLLILTVICIVFLLLAARFSSDAVNLPDSENTATTQETSNSPNSAKIQHISAAANHLDGIIGEIQDALLDNEYENARNLLTGNAIAPDNLSAVLCYVELYEHDQDYDRAADIMISYITDIWNPQNIAIKDNPAYTGLVEVGSHPLSKNIQTRYDTCLNACDEAAARFAAVRSLIKEKDYESALELCTTLKQDGTSDNMLFWYLNDCYRNLEKYEDYAAYLISLQKEVKKETYFSLYLPTESSVHYALQEVYPYVSDKTRKEIDSLEFKKKYDAFTK